MARNRKPRWEPPEASRMNTWIGWSGPPTCFQFVVRPVKMSRMARSDRFLRGFRSLTTTARPKYPAMADFNSMPRERAIRCSSSLKSRDDTAMSQVSSSRAAMPETDPRLSSSTATPGCSAWNAAISLGPSSSPNVSEPRMESVSSPNAAPAASQTQPATHQPERSFMISLLRIKPYMIAGSRRDCQFRRAPIRGFCRSVSMRAVRPCRASRGRPG